MFTFLGKLFTSVFLGVSALFFGGTHQTPPPAESTTSPVAVAQTNEVSASTTATTSNTQAKKETTTTPTPSVVHPVTTAPSNTELCNGSYYSACPSGQDFVCPHTGSAFCQVPTSTPVASASTTAQQAATTSAAQNSTGLVYPVTVTVHAINAQNYKGMGSYVLYLNVTNNHVRDIYIPKTTSADTTGNIIGFSYIIEGDRFFGSQLGSVSCPLPSDYYTSGVSYPTDYCTIKPGQEVTIEVAVGLNPTVQGNYSIKFTNVKWTDNLSGGYGIVAVNAQTDLVNTSGI